MISSKGIEIRNSLLTKLIVIMCVVLLLSFGTIGYLILGYIGTVVEDQVESRGSQTIEGMAGMLNQYLGQYDMTQFDQQEQLERFRELFHQTVRDNNYSHIMIIDHRGRVIVHSHEQEEGHVLKDELSIRQATAQGTLVLTRTDPGGKGVGREFSTPIYVGGEHFGSLVIGIPIGVLDEYLTQALTYFLRLGLIIAGIAAAVLYVSLRRITNDIHKVTLGAKRMSEGDLTIKTMINRRDELGYLAESFHVMVESLSRFVRQVRLVADQDFESARQLDQFAEQSAKAIEGVTTTITELANGGGEVAHSVNVIVDDMGKIDQQLTLALRMGTDINELVQQTLVRVSEGNDALDVTMKQVELVEKTVTGTASTIQQLGEKTNAITEMITLIENIATQTHLLSFNAAIEAARAGEQGRGFAVVAEEVRLLAEESHRALQEIGGFVKEIQDSSHHAVSIVEQDVQHIRSSRKVVENMAGKLGQIESYTYKVLEAAQNNCSAVDNVKGLSSQVVSEVEEVSAMIQEFIAGTQQVASSAQEQTASIQQLVVAAKQLEESSNKLVNHLSWFRLE